MTDTEIFVTHFGPRGEVEERVRKISPEILVYLGKVRSCLRNHGRALKRRGNVLCVVIPDTGSFKMEMATQVRNSEARVRSKRTATERNNYSVSFSNNEN